MIFSSIFNLTLISIFAGYSFAIKKYLFKRDNDVSNLDLVYGYLFLISLSLILNFFFALKYFFFPIIIIGLIFFFNGYKKKKIQINFLYHFLILFFLSFIIYKNGDNVDTPMYHLQIIKWLYNEKIVFGLSNLEIRFASSSLWFNLIALFKLKINNFSNIYTFNLIPFSILIYQIFQKKHDLSYIFIILTVSFLFLFSFLHPYNNGIILNHLHNTELDTVGMVFFIISFYLLLKFIEDESLKTLRLLILSSSICIFIKLSYLGIFLFLLFVLLKFYKKKIILIFTEKLNIIVFLVFLIWFLKNLINSGCLVFPITFTCFGFDWSPDIEEIDFHSKEIMGYARDTRDRLRYTDFNHTIHSLGWFLPWFKDYALNTAFLQISFFVSIFSLIFLIVFNFLNLLDDNFNNKKKTYFLIYLLFIPNFYIWFQAPEIRFGWGTFISFSCFSVAILLFHLKYSKYLKLWINKNIPMIILFLLVFDNRDNLHLSNLFNPYVKNINYSNIIKIKEVAGYDIYKSRNWQCFDFKNICVNSEKEKYEIKKKYGYLFIKSDFD